MFFKIVAITALVASVYAGGHSGGHSEGHSGGHATSHINSNLHAGDAVPVVVSGGGHGGDGGHGGHGGHGADGGHGGHEVHYDYYAYPKYEFDYGVDDDHTKDHKAQHESRDGDVVEGIYSFHEADGTIRTVKYVADKKGGFNAEVIRSGKAIHPSYSHGGHH